MRIGVSAPLVIVAIIGFTGVAQAVDLALAEGGSRYSGIVTVEIFRPDGSRLRSDRGDAEMVITAESGGHLDLSLVASIREANDAGFAVSLTPIEEGGYTVVDEQLNFDIGPEGEISGQLETSDQSIIYGGRLAAESLLLESEIRLATANPHGLEAGTRFVFTHQLDREREPEAVPPSQAAKDLDDCAEVVWRLRLVPNLSGGPMGMVRVPVCVSR